MCRHTITYHTHTHDLWWRHAAGQVREPERRGPRRYSTYSSKYRTRPQQRHDANNSYKGFLTRTQSAYGQPQRDAENLLSNHSVSRKERSSSPLTLDSTHRRSVLLQHSDSGGETSSCLWATPSFGVGQAQRERDRERESE